MDVYGKSSVEGLDGALQVVCPYCGNSFVVTNANYSKCNYDFNLGNPEGSHRFEVEVIACASPKCRRFSLAAKLMKENYRGGNALRHPVVSWQLVPPAGARTFPDYIPEQIRSDYTEACLIRDLSPKASATLARRALQGMIRHFWGVRGKHRLFDEIREIEDQVDRLTYEAIDAVRTVGNIGAHMEQDVNLIVDVDPSEANLLIGLIEMLIEEWYIARHEREERLAGIKALGAKKEAETKGARPGK